MIDGEDDIAFTEAGGLCLGQRGVDSVASEAVEEGGSRQRGTVLLSVEVLPRAQNEVGEREKRYEREKQVLKPCGSLQHKKRKKAGCMVAVSPLIFSRCLRTYLAGLLAMIWSLILS